MVDSELFPRCGFLIGMDHQIPTTAHVDAFIAKEIQSVPHLEALLLLWSSRPKAWTLDELADALYVQRGEVQKLVGEMLRQNLAAEVSEGGERFRYDSAGPEQDSLLRALELTYKRELIRITRMIHAKGTPAVRDFAQAFRFRRE